MKNCIHFSDHDAFFNIYQTIDQRLYLVKKYVSSSLYIVNHYHPSIAVFIVTTSKLSELI